MEWVVRHRAGASYLLALALPLAVAGVLVPVRASFAGTASALVFVAVILAVAVFGNRVSGALTTLSSTIWFDFFLTRPYERLTITQRPDIETAVSLFVVGLVVTELAARNRRHSQSASEGSNYIGLIHGVSELAASGANASEVIEQAGGEIMELLNLRSWHYDEGFADRSIARIEPDGHVIHAGLLWRVDHMGLPGPHVELLVKSRGTVRGRFVLSPTPGVPVPLQRRIVAVALADQVGAVLTPRLRSA